MPPIQVVLGTPVAPLPATQTSNMASADSVTQQQSYLQRTDIYACNKFIPSAERKHFPPKAMIQALAGICKLITYSPCMAIKRAE